MSISMGKLIENYRSSFKEAKGGKYADRTPSELVYNLIEQVEEVRNDVAISLNEMDEMLVDLKKMMDVKGGMVIDPNPFDDTDGVVNGKVVKPMKIDADGDHLRSRKRDNLLNANLTK